MAEYQQFRMTPARLLTAAANLLHEMLIDCTRADAKRRFRDVLEGRRLGLVRLRMDDASELQMNLTLDASAYEGELNFSAFRRRLLVLLHVIGNALQAQGGLNLMNDESGKRLLFNLPAIVGEGPQGQERVNVLVLGVDLALPGEATLQLMFLDPSQYRRQPLADGAANDGVAND